MDISSSVPPNRAGAALVTEQDWIDLVSWATEVTASLEAVAASDVDANDASYATLSGSTVAAVLTAADTAIDTLQSDLAGKSDVGHGHTNYLQTTGGMVGGISASTPSADFTIGASADANYREITLSGNRQITLSTAAGTGHRQFRVRLLQDGTGGRTTTLTGANWTLHNGEETGGVLLWRSTAAAATYDMVIETRDGGTNWDVWVLNGPYEERSIFGQVQGTLSGGVQSFKYIVPFDMQVTGVHMWVVTAPTGSNLIAQLYKNGTTNSEEIYTTQANRPTITAGGTEYTTKVAPNVASFSAGDDIYFGLDQVGSSVAGADLGFHIFYRRV